MPLRAGVLLLAALAASAARAQDVSPFDRPSGSTTARQAAIEAGLEYLARAQNRDGSFGQDEAGIVGITSLSLLAFMAQGYQEGRGRFSQWETDDGQTVDVVRRGVNYLLRLSLPMRNHPYISEYGKPVGYIYLQRDSDSRMHGHGYATQVLVLAYGSGRLKEQRSAELRTKIQRAVRVIENSQTITGGWGYQPNHATTHEGSVTVTVVQALRLARDAGFVVDRRVHEKGLAYLRDSQKSDGSFKYSLMSDTSTAALTAAALTAMHGFGEYYSKAVDEGLSYLIDRFRSSHEVQWPFYARYYAAQAFYRAGGEHWDYWVREEIPRILDRQEREGHWDDRGAGDMRRGSHGRAYATAFSVLALSVQDGQLPLFQR